jgi:hypothetical protein
MLAQHFLLSRPRRTTTSVQRIAAFFGASRDLQKAVASRLPLLPENLFPDPERPRMPRALWSLWAASVYGGH